MMKREKLLEDLRNIKQNEYVLDDREKAYDYAQAMLTYIGDTDPELRDHLIYKTFYKWIIEKEYFSKTELKQILVIVLGEDYILYELGNDGDDSVFTRAFSALVIAMILGYHRKYSFLDFELYNEVKEKLITYYSQETDMRTFVEVKGWADSIAHGADALDELVACKESNEEICLEVLDAIGKKLANMKYFINEEVDERITTAVFRIIESNLLDDSDIINWLNNLYESYESEKGTNMIYRRKIRMNIKNLVRSLYFRLLHSKEESTLLDPLVEMEKKLNTFL
jgi:hypothetical protein